MNEQTQTTPVADSGTGDAGGEQPGRSPGSATGAAAINGGIAGPSILQRLTGLFRPRTGSSLRDDLTDALAVTASEGDFTPAERAMLNNILRLREVRVEDVMIPRSEVKAVDQSTKLGDLLAIFEESGHSRMPVFHETLDDPRGMVHIRDVVVHLTRAARQKRTRSRKAVAGAAPAVAVVAPAEQVKFDLGRVALDKSIAELGLTRPILFVPPSMLASDLMARMQAARIQLALVIDEYGGTDGLASLEDIVEMVVGDIEDEHDEDEGMIVKSGEGIFIVDGRAEISEVAAAIGDAFKADEHEEDVDTIGGMIFNALGRVPARGEVVQAIPGFEFHVLDADPRRVKRVRIVQGRAADRRRARQPGKPAGEAALEPESTTEH